MNKELPILDHYQKLIAGATCRLCEKNGKLTPIGHCTLQHYDHDGGWPLKGYSGLRWLYIECPNCNYQWSLWKFGIPRHNPEVTDGN